MAANDASPEPAEPGVIAYVAAVAKEGLRLAVPLPGRLPRSVPPRGYTYGKYHFPAGTSVGVPMYEVHLDPESFPAPHQFLPERWLADHQDPSSSSESDHPHEGQSLGARERMTRDWAPFGERLSLFCHFRVTVPMPVDGLIN